MYKGVCGVQKDGALQFKVSLMDEAQVLRTLKRMAHEILEKNRELKDVCFIGIKRRGISLAKMLAANIELIEGVKLPVGMLDITFYRDDLVEALQAPRVNNSDIPFDITNKRVILADDVLYTGRTVRAAIDALFSLGRPQCVQLAILIDRGHRELPFRADFVGKNIPTSRNEVVAVCLPPYDAKIAVDLYTQKD